MQICLAFTARVMDHLVGSIETPPVIRHVSRTVAMGGNLDMVPGVCGPGLRVTRQAGGMPPGGVALAGGVLPTMRIYGALEAVKHGVSVRHYLVHIQFQVRQLRRINDVNPGVVDKMRSFCVPGEREREALSPVFREGHRELSRQPIERRGGNWILG